MSFYNNLPKPFFVLAPLDDVTDTVFRQIIAGCAKPDLYFTEFVNVDGLQSAGREKLMPKLRFGSSEIPLIAQIWGKIPGNYEKTAQQIADGTLGQEANTKLVQSLHVDEVQGASETRNKPYLEYGDESIGADNTAIRHKSASTTSSTSRQDKTMQNFAGVDINMGCPDKSICKNGCCSALINDRELAEQIIDATRKGLNGKLPISVKTRIGFNNIDLTWIEFLLKQNLDVLTVHGRTRAEMSKVPNHWEVFGEIIKLRDKTAPSTLIVGNGDVQDRAHGEQLAKKYKLDGIMIGRGVFADPFSFAKKSPWGSWSKQQKVELYKKHVQLFADTWQNNERKIVTLNKFCKIYINGFDGAKEMREELMKQNTAKDLLKLLSVS